MKFKHMLRWLAAAVVMATLCGCFEPDAELKVKAEAALAAQPAFSQGKRLDLSSAAVHVGKSAATVSIPYTIQKPDGSLTPGSLMVYFSSMAKRWEFDRIADNPGAN